MTMKCTMLLCLLTRSRKYSSSSFALLVSWIIKKDRYFSYPSYDIQKDNHSNEILIKKREHLRFIQETKIWAWKEQIRYNSRFVFASTWVYRFLETIFQELSGWKYRSRPLRKLDLKWPVLWIRECKTRNLKKIELLIAWMKLTRRVGKRNW